MMKSQKKRKKTAKRTLWTLSQRLEVIEMRDNGASWVKIAHEKQMNEATARSIYKEKDKIRAQGKLHNLIHPGSTKSGPSLKLQGKK